MAQVSKRRKNSAIAGEATSPAAGSLGHSRPECSWSVCVLAVPASVSPGLVNQAERRRATNAHLDTCAMPPKILRRRPHGVTWQRPTHAVRGDQLNARHQPRRRASANIAAMIWQLAREPTARHAHRALPVRRAHAQPLEYWRIVGRRAPRSLGPRHWLAAELGSRDDRRPFRRRPVAHDSEPSINGSTA